MAQALVRLSKMARHQRLQSHLSVSEEAVERLAVRHGWHLHGETLFGRSGRQLNDSPQALDQPAVAQ
jgi:hypothetical protein